MSIQSPFIPGARVAFVDDQGVLTRAGYLFLQNLINLAKPSSGITVDDLATQLLFDADNTSQVAELQREIDGIVVEDAPTSPFETTGTVRYVNATAPSGVLGVSGVPYQNNGTVTFAWSGTSGGVPYFSSATGMASSALLTSNAVVIGGGAGTTPATISVGTNNQFLAGNTGSSPGFRQLVAASADLANQGSTVTVLHGNASGNPSWGAVVLTTDVSGTLPVANGGTGIASATAYAVLCGGTTSTGAFQSVSSVGTSGQALISNGAGALPTFQDIVATTVPSYVFAFAASHG